jgi:hypothetical protein
VKYLPLFHHFKVIYQFPKHMIFLVKIVANASFRNLLAYKLAYATSIHHINMDYPTCCKVHIPLDKLLDFLIYFTLSCAGENL